mmetsp:Transcript_19542/g.42487  ORF Transcript_19542/g.42487 Transcript_19542/m.42487 type:complete len:221 (+) Transcript_19542:2663-3325(+)
MAWFSPSLVRSPPHFRMSCTSLTVFTPVTSSVAIFLGLSCSFRFNPENFHLTNTSLMCLNFHMIFSSFFPRSFFSSYEAMILRTAVRNSVMCPLALILRSLRSLVGCCCCCLLLLSWQVLLSWLLPVLWSVKYFRMIGSLVLSLIFSLGVRSACLTTAMTHRSSSWCTSEFREGQSVRPRPSVLRTLLLLMPWPLLSVLLSVLLVCDDLWPWMPSPPVSL